MYIIAIAWIYVVLLMSFTEESIVAGVATFLFYGLAPLSVLLYLMGTPQRRRNRRRREALVREPEQASTGPETPADISTTAALSGASDRSSDRNTDRNSDRSTDRSTDRTAESEHVASTHPHPRS